MFSFDLENDAQAFQFPAGTTMSPGEIRFACQSSSGQFAFGIGRSDSVSLNDNTGNLVSTSGVLPGLGSAFYTYQFNKDTETYAYAVPTPNAENVFQETVVYISEVADKGAEGVCNGGMFALHSLQFYNVGTIPILTLPPYFRGLC